MLPVSVRKSTLDVHNQKKTMPAQCSYQPYQQSILSLRRLKDHCDPLLKLQVIF